MDRRRAEYGATTREIMAAVDWKTSREVDRYTADMDRENAATSGFAKHVKGLDREQKLATTP